MVDINAFLGQGGTMRITLRCYAESNEYLPASCRQREFPLVVAEGVRVGEIVSSLGIHGIDLILDNGCSVGPEHVVQDGDRISVFPVFDAIDIGSVSKIPDRPERRSRFVLDVHLGKLAHHLRMMGFDTVYRNDTRPEQLLAIARREDRILLSKSCGLTRDPGVTASYCVRSSDPREQLLEVLRRFDLLSLARPYTRCLHCNVQVHAVPKGEVVDRLPQRSRDAYDAFTLCPVCNRVYWEGTHVERMRRFMEGITAALGYGGGQP